MKYFYVAKDEFGTFSLKRRSMDTVFVLERYNQIIRKKMSKLG